MMNSETKTLYTHPEPLLKVFPPAHEILPLYSHHAQGSSVYPIGGEREVGHADGIRQGAAVLAEVSFFQGLCPAMPSTPPHVDSWGSLPIHLVSGCCKPHMGDLLRRISNTLWKAFNTVTANLSLQKPTLRTRSFTWRRYVCLRASCRECDGVKAVSVHAGDEHRERSHKVRRCPGPWCGESTALGHPVAEWSG